MNITKEYIQYHDTYKKKYKNVKTLVLMQVGSFYEAYATDDEGPNLQEISSILNIVCTKRDKKISEVSIKNPYMLGFPKVAEGKFINVLMDNNYTVILIDQVTLPPEPKREVVGIYSPGVYMNGIIKPDNNFVVSIYLEEIAQKTGGKTLPCVGLTAIDITTGQNLIYEAHSTGSDQKYALDETIRFINSINPSEILFLYNGSKEDMSETIKYLDIDPNKILHIRDKVDQKYLKLTFQNEYLQKVYKESKSMVSAIDYLDLEKYPFIIVSMIALFDFLYDHGKNIIDNIRRPEIFYDTNNLILGNNCVSQLNIVDNLYNKNNKYNNLFEVVNNTSTAMGRRLLRSRLISPLICQARLTEEYGYIEEMLKNDFYLEIEENLKKISDIERLERRILLQQIHPFEFVQFISGINEIGNLSSKINKNKNLKKLAINSKMYLENIFNYTVMNFALNDISGNIFMPNVYPDIDELVKKIEFNSGFLEKLAKTLSNMIDSNEDNIKVQTMATGGHYLLGSKKRVISLICKLEKNKEIDIDGFKFDTTSLVFKDNKSTTKITYDGLDEKSEEINELQKKLNELSKKYFISSVSKIYNKNKECIKEMIRFVSYIDMYKSNAKTAKMNKYYKPVIEELKTDDSNKNSYIECKELRHPIIEKLIDYEYIPHDITLGKETKGIMLYGLNSSGKSSSMKALGICLIMAQAGMYVPAKCKYFPYKSLYTRITGNDNLFRGLSSFSLEMLELKAILNRSDKNTLVIGDEICRGTENISANAIVATTIIKLSKLETSFIFATHLHDISNMQRIKELSNVKPYHLSVSYDNKTDSLIYDRKLTEGSGDNIYGIMVAKHILKDKSFIDMALEIKNEILGDYGSLISGKTSKYNNDLVVHECQNCGKKDIKGHISNLQTHHINFQKDCKDGFVNEKPYLKMNSKANLIILCTDCHENIHKGNLDIKKKVLTTRGSVATK
jgi:DNA mismatch repair protein MutS